MKTTGRSGSIRLTHDKIYYLATPYTSAQVTVALWLIYESKGSQVPQTFLAAGDQTNGDRGIHFYQEDGSREELTFQIKTESRHCVAKFRVFQRVWTHLIFTWIRNNRITLYRNGKIVTDFSSNVCMIGSFPNIPNSLITLGSSALPTASFDDVIVWGITLSKVQVERLFRYYKGKCTKNQ